MDGDLGGMSSTGRFIGEGIETGIRDPQPQTRQAITATMTMAIMEMTAAGSM